MLFRVPTYYNSFRCSADKCSDNCCIGWEIEADSSSSEYYKSLEGSFGEKLRKNISNENTFILKDERCPFLNENNLCEIIINCGENKLCQICSDHPRYFEWYSNIKEGGIGLSCEEAARLILTAKNREICESFTNEDEEPVDEALFSLLFSSRETLFKLLKEKLPLRDKLCKILDFARDLQFAVDNPHLEKIHLRDDCDEIGSLTEIVALFNDFEPINQSWSQELSLLQSKKAVFCEETKEYSLNLTEYFLWRYFLKGVFDAEILSKVVFSVVSVLIITLMTNTDKSLDVWIEKSKLYSKQMEYSDENRELFYDYCYNKSCLNISRLKNLIMNI